MPNINKYRRVLLVIVCMLLFIMLFHSSIYSHKDLQDNARIKKWEDALKSEPLLKNAKELKLEYYFPGEDLEKKDIYLYQGSHICKDSMDRIFVSDFKASKVLEFDLDGKFIRDIGRRGQGPGEFRAPLHVFSDHNNNLYVNGNNRRIEMFNSNGEFVKSIIILKSYSWYAIASNGNIYANSLLSKIT